MYTKKLWRWFIIGLFLLAGLNNNSYGVRPEGLDEDSRMKLIEILSIASQRFIIPLMFTYHLFPLCFDILREQLVAPRPKVLLPDANLDLRDRWRRWWNNYKSPHMIFPQEIAQEMGKVIQIAQKISDLNGSGAEIAYNNLILHGDSGTGKTLFARYIADKAGMYFAPITAGSLLQKGAGISYLIELFALAQKSSRGMVIFIDEAQDLFADRARFKPDSELHQLLNYLLSYTGDGSDKFMLVMAANNVENLDPAVIRRFHNNIKMPLPDMQTREKLIRYYANSFLFDKKSNGEKFVNSARKYMSNETIIDMVRKTDGLSNADVKNIIEYMRKSVIISKDLILREQHFSDALEAVKSTKALRKNSN